MIPAAASRSHDAFRDAERHSRLVRVLRIATPAVAVAAVVATVASAVLQPMSSEIHVDTSGIGVGGPSVAMDAPKMRGFNSQDRAYEVSAATAHQTIAAPNRIGLDDLTARIELPDASWARMSAPTGLYDADAQVLNLDHDVRIVSDKGDDARLQDARAELKTGRIVTDRPVAIQLEGSYLTADRMEVLNSGDRMLFSGRVRLTLKRIKPAGQAVAPEAPSQPSATTTQ